MSLVPSDRVRVASEAPIAEDGWYVLYWVSANRRPRWNHALDYAMKQVQRLGKTLVVVESMRTGFAWAANRLHRLGMLPRSME